MNTFYKQILTGRRDVVNEEYKETVIEEEDLWIKLEEICGQ